MSYKTLLWLFVALICGTLTAFVVKQLFYSSSSKVESVQEEIVRSVLVAKVNLKAGTELSAQNVRFDLIPETQIPRDAIYSFTGISKRKVVNDIPEGAILRNLYDLEFVQEEKVEPSYNPPGYSVVPIEIESVIGTSDQRNIADLIPLDKVIYKDDCVDLHIISEQPISNALDSLKNVNRSLVDRLLVENVIIVDILSEKRFSKNEKQPERYSVVSLLLNDEQKNLVEQEANQGKLRLVIKKKNEPTFENGSSQSNEPTPFLSVENDDSVNNQPNQPINAPIFKSFSAENSSFISDEFRFFSDNSIAELNHETSSSNDLLVQKNKKSTPDFFVKPSDHFSQEWFSLENSNSSQNGLNTISEQNKNSQINNQQKSIDSNQNSTDQLMIFEPIDFQVGRPILSPFPNVNPNATQNNEPSIVDQENSEMQNPSSPLDEKPNNSKQRFRSRNTSLNQLSQLSQ
ncbi:MAG: hypothetical protein Q4C95_06215 [Planctomycetia bacterium]|nr:hypothetical protein [Planctomycetia bacterium]